VVADAVYCIQKLPADLWCETIHHLVHHIDKSLGVVQREVSGYLGLIIVREDRGNKRDTFRRSERLIEQSFPCWRV